MIQINFYWILGNGKKIKIWADRILGHPPLSFVLPLEYISKWELDSGILTLYDLSTWDQNGNWNGWRMLHPLEPLKHDVDLLLPLLHCIAPISKNSKDSIVWGNNGTYIVKEGYKLMQIDTTIASTNIWKKFGIWIVF